jgi:hypothetical protein
LNGEDLVGIVVLQNGDAISIGERQFIFQTGIRRIIVLFVGIAALNFIGLTF